MASLRQTFAHNLRRLREERGWSQDDLAERLETDRTSISRIERLAPNVALDKVALLALAFGVDSRHLLSEAPLDVRTAGTSSRRELPTPQFVGASVRRHREAAGISQRELGDRVGLDRNHISRIEVGSTNIALDTLEKVATALGVSAVDLLGQK
ncbi:helix-turn-helix domain-containing protein [Cupriavidus taiwanensis]|uniref:helix-turn-helix domain-containing protein n=1 Tax=Cupriavidus taiwanensis TaxID=164546 RepID=UPI000E107024|nr:Transcriptional regulator, XRE family [Cupriavidus taiwanensis]SOY85794.1 Transcriptional regulator, XRE family [Cupriavidus taiwanensis]SPA15666.1 Transcriptional regulator, XRE family [Cupriavidus taiwanensis]SPD44904.1 DNA-binding protein [Cupriavidus taiwanensis]